MTELNQLLWNHAIENEDWEEAARLERLAKDLARRSIEGAQTNPIIPAQAEASEPTTSAD